MKLSEYLLENGNRIELPCGGNGVCGKCAVRINDLKTKISEGDRAFFSENELEAGYRLACQMEIEDGFDITAIEILNTSEKMDVLTAYVNHNDGEMLNNVAYDVAVDIGTTTLAFALIINKKVIDTYGMANSQRQFGADIISRIDAANKGYADELHRWIIDNINEGIDYLIGRNKLEAGKIERIVVAGNTTMLHILLGYSLAGLGKYPFEPISLSCEKRNAAVVLDREDFGKATIVTLPGISAFVGADIVAGIYYLDICNSKKNCLFIDLGTNGEMALVTSNGMWVTSTAAGPAFEGVNISCGKPSIAGAICDVTIRNGRIAQYKTISDRTPIGICGSGLVALVSELLDNGIIDNNGTLVSQYSEDGFNVVGNIIVTQKDIREFQLAKSAIRTGIDILLNRAGIDADKLDCIYIAGGFGNGINVKKAIKIGLIPSGCRIEGGGNTSLAGCIKYINSIMENGATVPDFNFINGAKEIVLASEEEFDSAFISNINFGE